MDYCIISNTFCFSFYFYSIFSLLYGLLVFSFSLCVCAMGIFVFIDFHFMDFSARCDLSWFLCYLVYRPQGCNKLELKDIIFRPTGDIRWRNVICHWTNGIIVIIIIIIIIIIKCIYKAHFRGCHKCAKKPVEAVKLWLLPYAVTVEWMAVYFINLTSHNSVQNNRQTKADRPTCIYSK